MTEYRYRATAFSRSNGKVLRDEFKTITGGEVYAQQSEVGELAFRRLVDRWNRNGLLGIANGGPIYVYTVIPAP